MADTTCKIKHHYIPRFYLEGFCDERNMIWTYCKEPYCQKPEKTAFENYFYALYLADGTMDFNTYENMLSDEVESPAAEALRMLRAGELPSYEPRQKLALLFGFMLTRTPFYRAHYEQEHNRELMLKLKITAGNKDLFREMAAGYEKSNSEPMADNLEEFRQGILSGEINYSIHPNLSLYIMKTIGVASAKLLEDMKWILIKVPENLNFLTSDNPIFILNPTVDGFYSPGLRTAGIRVYVPISKNMVLLMVQSDQPDVDNPGVKDNEAIVDEINKGIICTAQRFIYGCKNDKKINRLIGDMKKLNAIQNSKQEKQ